MSIRQLTVPIHSNEAVSDDFFEMRFGWEGDVLPPRPGQFLTVRVGDGTAPLLRRPFAFSSFDDDSRTAAMIYQRRGPGTQAMTGMTAGDTLDLIAPLGNWFPAASGDGESLLVAGGVGLGPILFLATTLARSGRPFRFVFGARSGSLLPSRTVFGDIPVTICTDDGTEGFAGNTVDYLRTLETSRTATLYACGPTPMLKGCHEFSRNRGIPCWTSMEQTMACGVGACMGCAVKTTTGTEYARVCKDGPIFNSEDIAWT
jgi:dihydroorotate dehydrogenase electron transfer subunit